MFVAYSKLIYFTLNGKRVFSSGFELDHCMTSPDFNTQIGSRIKAFRSLRKLTQEDFADLLNMSKRAYQDIETGKTNIDIPQLERIAKTLETTVFDILGMSQGKFFFAYNAQQGEIASANFNSGKDEKIKFLEEKISLLESKIRDLEEINRLLREKSGA